MKLVTIILLLCVHSADPADCPGVKGMVKFCNGGDKLEITITTSETVTWNFGDGDLPTGNAETSDATKTVMTLPTLTAAHTGVYKATYDPNKVEKFTIIVGAKTCTAVTPCIVKPGGSIHLDSGEPTGVTWYFKAPSGSETEIKDSGTDDPPKFTDTDKKELGLFNLQKAESGTYTAKKPSKAAKDFPVAVRAPVTEAKVQKRQSGCNVILECNVDGDAKSFKWTNGGTVVADATQKQLTIQKVDAGANADYVCKATDYDNGEKTSATFAYTYAVSDVRITRKGKVLTCEAKGVVKSFKWEMEDGTAVTSQHGAVDAVESKFKLNSKAKGNFVCVATGCDDKAKTSNLFSVDGEGGEEGGSSTNHDESDNEGPRHPGSGPQGASTSVALLLISVLVELYVMML